MVSIKQLLFLCSFLFLSLILFLSVSSNTEFENHSVVYTAGGISQISTPFSFQNAFVIPEKIRPGEIMLIQATITGAKKVIAHVYHEKGFDIITLHNDKDINVWEGHWQCHNTKDKTWYHTTIIAFDSKENSIEKKVIWQDPTISHPAEDIEPGTFEDGDFTFEENLHVEKSVLVYEDLHVADGTLEVFNTTKVVKAKNLNIENNLDVSSINSDSVTSDLITTSSAIVNNNLGVGKDVPEEKLHISGNTLVENGNIVIKNGKLGVNVEMPLKSFEISGDSTFTGNLYVNNGKIGINVETPTNSFEVSGDSNFNGKITVFDETTLNSKLKVTGESTFNNNVDFSYKEAKHFIVERLVTVDNSLCTEDLKGYIYFNSDENTFMGCDGEEFRHLSYQPISITGDDTGGRKWSDGTFAISCYHYRFPTDNSYLYSGSTGDGTYWIDPDGEGGLSEFMIHCDMTSDGGGWTLIAKTDGSSNNHYGDSANNRDNLKTGSLTSSGYIGDTDRLSIGKFYRVKCASTVKYAYVDYTYSFNVWWGRNQDGLHWSDSYSSNPSDYTVEGLSDCGSDCGARAIAYSGREWYRSGQNGCGLFHGYGNAGYIYGRIK